MNEILRYSNCFVCGDKNRSGLQARFFFDGEEAITEIVAMDHFEGYKGIFHGGIISTLLDEVMIKAILAGDIYAVTAELTVKYLKPVNVGDRLTCRGRILSQKRRLFITEGSVQNQNEETVATATGKYIQATSSLKDRLENSVDE